MKLKSNLSFALLFLAFIGFAVAYSVNPGHHKTETKLLPKPLVPQTFNHKTYEKMWNTVDSLQNKGLYASALEICDKIFKKASAENNPVQVTKAVIFKMKFNSYIKEEEYVVAISELEKISATAPHPLKQLIHSVTADVYYGYYQRNRWKFYNRSTTVEFKNDDISTWDLKTICAKTTQEFNLSLSDPDLSKNTDIKDFEPLLNYYSAESKRLKPTLYDFLAWRAYQFFASNEFEVIRPAERFTLNNEKLLGSRQDFLSDPLKSNDSLSTKLHATRIIASLLQFHLNDKEDPYPLVYCDLERLSFVRKHSAHSFKDSLYFESLQKLSDDYKTHESWSEIQYYIADYVSQLAAKYNPRTGNQHKNDYLKAIEICQVAIDKFPKSHGASMCKSKISSIKTKSIRFTTNDCNISNVPSLASVETRNVQKLWFRLIPVGWDFDLNEERYYDHEKFVKKLLSFKPIKTFELELKDDGDHQNHTMDFTVPELPSGAYYLISSATPDFKMDKNSIDYEPYTVSNIGYTSNKDHDNGDVTFYFLNRKNGQPLSGAKCTIINYDYESRSYKYHRSRGKTYTADANGKVVVEPTTKNYRYFYVDVTFENERYLSNRQHYQYKPYERAEYESIQTYFFTDRKIYRPGQTVYFKGIQIRSVGGKNPELVTNNSETVTFYDVNQQKVADLNVTTNEYGSFSGSFTAPQGVLNGNMHISDGHGSHNFLVEEYKRPKFEVEFKNVEGTYRLNDTIVSKGLAKSYSGAMVDGGEVKYRIVRNVSYWRWYWWWGVQPYYQPTEILSGTTTTNEKGEFEIKFNAIPDKSTNPKHKPVFNYIVYADVTDINGETRSSTQSINAGYHTMQIGIGVADPLDRNGKDVVKLSTTNLNYNKVPAKGKFRITRLIHPNGVLMDRKVSVGDRHQLSKEEFKKLFPYELYDDENNYEKWARSRAIFQADFDTEKSDSLILTGLKNWEPGLYVAEAFATDKWMQEIKETMYFTVYDEKATTLPSPEPFFMKALNYSAEPGEEIKLRIGSSFPEVRLLLEWDVNGKTTKQEFITLKNEVKQLSFKIEEEHRGNISVTAHFIYNNRFFTERVNYTIPFTNKQLDIDFETFRNKLVPGQDEEWKINIRGKKGEKLAAELLLTMYDASLDAFASNSFYMNLFNGGYSNKYWEASDGFSTVNSNNYQNNFNTYISLPYRYMYELNWFGYYPSNYYYNEYYEGYDDSEDVLRGGNYKNRSVAKKDASKAVAEEAASLDMAELKESPAPPPPPPPPGTSTSTTKNTAGFINSNGDEVTGGEYQNNGLAQVKVRTNLGETAFFFPHLETNENGDVSVKFKVPESLTRWKILGLGHTKALKTGTLFGELVTQKDLMVVPNMPRFLRESDEITITGKITNLSEEELSGNAQLMLMDAFNQKPIDHLFELKEAVKSFTAKGKQSTSVSWTIKVPFGVEAVTWRIAAKAKHFTDGEESALPVLSNRMMVTESIPLHIRKKGSKEFTFEKLLNSGKSSSLKNHKLTLEYCSNPAWYGIQSLPYLMEYPHECAEQTFSRFYANSIAHNIANSNPKIKAVFDAWKSTSPETFLSNLEKNQELKAVVLEETPWVLDAKNESERKKRVGLLFDFNKMADELERAIKKLEKMQAPNGGWPWFPGMPESRYITQHIVTGLGHLDKLGVKKIREDKRIWDMVQDAVRYLDHLFVEDFRDLKRYNKNYLKEKTIGYYQVQYLYARSYFRDLKLSGETKEAVDYNIKQEQKYWLDFNLYAEAMIALNLNRYDDKKTSADITKSLKERSLYSEEMGRYWKEVTVGYYWYEAPIETQAMMIECFDEAANDQIMVEDLKVWLLKNKQTNAWQTTKATTEACYALLLRGSDWLANDEQVEVQLGGKVIDPKAMGVKTEAGTGYYKMNWNGEEIKPEMGKIKLTTTTNSVSWGALHWQYFENIDKITGHETPIKLKKELFLVVNTESGPVIKPIGKTKLKVGDKVRVRIELRTDRQMEFVHMKDMRAAGFEPINVISRYKWQDGLGYYESTRDAATHFFFDNIGKGTYVFEYDLRVSHAGDFSNGMAQIQCMYAPEFNSHSDGIRVNVVK